MVEISLSGEETIVERLDKTNLICYHRERINLRISKDGFGGDAVISAAVNSDVRISVLEFLQLEETPGLGMRAVKRGVRQKVPRAIFPEEPFRTYKASVNL